VNEGMTVAVTGGASGIGLAVAKTMAAKGCPVVIGDLDVAGLEAAKEEISVMAKGSISTYEVDVTSEEQVEGFIAAADSGESRLGCLVTCAAIYRTCAFDELDGETWDATANVNLRGTVLAAAAASRRMRDGEGGSIVLFSSIDSLISEPATAAYSAAKAAINSIARSMAVDLSKHKIAVNAIAPGWVLTPMTEEDLTGMPESAFAVVNPLLRAARPEEIAEVVRYLALDAPAFLTGSTLFVDGGQSAMAPMPA